MRAYDGSKWMQVLSSYICSPCARNQCQSGHLGTQYLMSEDAKTDIIEQVARD